MTCFFKGNFYWCDSKKSDRIKNVIYFAPYFTEGAAKKHPGTKSGISHIARIKNIYPVETFKDLEDKRGKIWIKRNDYAKEYFQNVFRRKNKTHFVFELENPVNAFYPPVTKDKLGIKGNIAGRYKNFDALFSLLENK